MNNNEEARGLVDSGHTRDTAFAIRVEGDERTPMMFSTWGFKAVSGIGKRAATIEDRSIVINLKRKAKSEKIARLRHARKADFADVASRLARVAKDQMATFSLDRPDLPEALNDRAQDNWEHLFAIADIAGGHWPNKTKQAALSLSGVENEEPSHNTLLLADIRNVFDATDDPYIRSADLVAALEVFGCADENRSNSLNLNGLCGCADETPLNGEREGNCDAVEAQGLAAQGLEAAKRGHDWLRAFWAELTPDEREAVGGQDALAGWKIIGARADQPRRDRGH